MHHRLQWFIHLRAYSHREGDEHPTYAPNWTMVHFIFTFPCRTRLCISMFSVNLIFHKTLIYYYYYCYYYYYYY